MVEQLTVKLGSSYKKLYDELSGITVKASSLMDMLIPWEPCICEERRRD